MKVFLLISGAVLAIALIFVVVIGYLFVSWANKPENVAALQKQRETESAQKALDEKERAAAKEDAEKEIVEKKANLKLAIDENFADNKFEFLDYKFDQSSQFKFKDNKFNYSVFSTRNSNPSNHFIFSREDFGDFAAEIEFEVHGYESRVGIFWDAQPNSDGNHDPETYQAAYSSAGGLDVKAAGDWETFNLGNFFEAVTTQKLRVERLGKSLKVSINDKMLSDKILKDGGQGKLGILLRNNGGNKKDSNPIDIDVKSFKVWK
ncbi:MAG TPA: hypothetical protein VGO50_08395 [Pyrinomonadaceae bacterium]|jgi:hypothetical protein|nr:hypothetical protein [Pyrinomonadaceae bacterium]